MAIEPSATLTMTDFLQNEAVTCPWCWERIEVDLDLSAGTQAYVEDCQVCCQPIDISFQVEDGELREVRAERSQ